jgi:hypothetical protein
MANPVAPKRSNIGTTLETSMDTIKSVATYTFCACASQGIALLT